MPECIDCGAPTRSGSRCPMHRVEHNNEHHEFFGQVSDVDVADRLLGKAINASSQGDGEQAVEFLTQASETIQSVSCEAWEQAQAARTRDSTGHEFRRYLREARQFLQLEADQ